MEKEFKEIIEESKKSLEKAEKKIEDLSEDFSEEAGEFWVDLKKRFAGVNDKLKDAYDDFDEKAELKGHLGMMEARDKLEQVKESAEEFTQKVSSKAQVELDVAALKAHLAKMESEDLWEEKQKELSHMYDDSKVEVEKLAKKAGKEINEIFLKLTEMV
ncbi:hypothetical protein ACLHDG_06575 [Sulfurovum sp. CS9]|uniref:hypothetical protein n=1 Tax=Sulfurovum sp. CS9 TaxID=3391146 RepID=UPI0039E81CA2